MLEVADLRRLIAARLVDQLGASGWRESAVHFARFGTAAADPRSFSPHAFAVGVPRTSFDSPQESSLTKRSATQGGGVISEMRVRWLSCIRADRQVEDLDTALDDEARVLEAVLGVDRTDGLHLSAVEFTRQVLGDGTWQVHELVLVARHRVAIRSA
jgi:hypothetical protein